MHRCKKCRKPTIKMSGSGYDSPTEDHITLIIGRYCKHCKILYVDTKLVENIEKL